MNVWKRIGQIALWVLFWYYLIPYTLLKKFVFKNRKHWKLWSNLSSIAIVFVLFIFLIGNSSGDDDTSDTKTSSSNSKPKIHYVVKKVGKNELEKAESKEKLLKKEKTKKQAEYEKLEALLVAKKKRAKREQAAAAKAEQENNTDDSGSTTTSPEHHQHHAAVNHGDLDTASAGKIIGDRNTKVYHVPGQAGYRMKSANAVYFSSEAEAQAAGYRKAKR